MALVSRKTKADKKVNPLKVRLLGSQRQLLDHILPDSGYETISDYIRDAVTEKMRRSELEKNEVQRLNQTISRLDKHVAGLRSLLRLDFATSATLARALMRYFPDDLATPQDFMQEVARQFKGQSGRTFDELSSEPEEKRLAAAGD